MINMKWFNKLFGRNKGLVEDTNLTPFLSNFLSSLNGFSYDFVQTNYTALFQLYKGLNKSCIDFIAMNESSGVPILYEYENQTDKHEPDYHPFIEFLDNLNPEFTNDEIKWIMSQSMRITGSIYLEIFRNIDDYPKEAWILPIRNSFSMERKVVNGVTVAYKYTSPDNKTRMIDERNIVNFRIPNPLNFYEGLGTIAGNPYVFDMENDLNIYQKNYLSNDASGRTYIEVNPDLSDDEIERVMKKYIKLNSGLKNVNKPRFLIDMKLSKSSDTPTEMDFNKTQELYENKVLMSHRIHPVLMGKLINANRATSQVAADHFHNFHMKPMMSLYASKWTQFCRKNYGEWNRKNGINTNRLKLEYNIPPLFDREMQLKELEHDCKVGSLRYNQYLKVRGYDPIYQLDENGNKTNKLDPKGFEFIKPYNDNKADTNNGNGVENNPTE